MGALPTLGGKRPRDGPHATIKHMLVKYTGLIKILVKTKCAPTVYADVVPALAYQNNVLNISDT